MKRPPGGNLADGYGSFRYPELRFDISLRNIHREYSQLGDYINVHYPFLSLRQISGVYGFHERFTRLYGGRPFHPAHALSSANLESLYKLGIPYYLPLTNHFVDARSYAQAQPFLEMHHRPGNRVGCVSDDLARWIKRDFPDYGLVASVIKNLSSAAQIEAALEIYDTVVVPPQLNDDLEFLERFEPKGRIVLFANNYCRYTCPAWICYKAISRDIRDTPDPYGERGSSLPGGGAGCSRIGERPRERADLGYVIFDLDLYREMGYRHFKLIPPREQDAIPRLPTISARISAQPSCMPDRGDEHLVWDAPYKISSEIRERFLSDRFQRTIQQAGEAEKCLYRSMDSILARFATPTTPEQSWAHLPARLRTDKDAYWRVLQGLVAEGLLVEPGPAYRPLFIVSAPRAGSSLLFETLACSGDLWTIGGEGHGIVEGLPGLHPAHRGFDSNRLKAADAVSGTTQRLLERFTRNLRDSHGKRYLQYPHRERPGEIRFLEKTPKNALRIPFLKEAFPDARFIYLYREPLGNISSILEGWRSGRFVTYQELPDWPLQRWAFLLPPGWRCLKGAPLAEIAAFQWRVTNATILTDLSRLPADDWCIVRYDDFCRAPKRHTQALRRFMGFEMDAGLKERLAGPLPLSEYTLTPPAPDKWRANQAELHPFLSAVGGIEARIRDLTKGGSG